MIIALDCLVLFFFKVFKSTQLIQDTVATCASECLTLAAYSIIYEGKYINMKYLMLNVIVLYF